MLFKVIFQSDVFCTCNLIIVFFIILEFSPRALTSPGRLVSSFFFLNCHLLMTDFSIFTLVSDLGLFYPLFGLDLS